MAREEAIRIKSPKQNAGAVLTTTALAWILCPEEKQQFCLASGKLLFFPDERKTAMQQSVRATPENICTSSASRVNHDRSEHQSPLWLKMDVVSTPKYMKNTIRKTKPRINYQTIKIDWENDKNKHEHAKPVIAGRGESIRKACSEYFSGICRQLQETGESGPLKYILRLEGDERRV